MTCDLMHQLVSYGCIYCRNTPKYTGGLSTPEGALGLGSGVRVSAVYRKLLLYTYCVQHPKSRCDSLTLYTKYYRISMYISPEERLVVNVLVRACDSTSSAGNINTGFKACCFYVTSLPVLVQQRSSVPTQLCESANIR